MPASYPPAEGRREAGVRPLVVLRHALYRLPLGRRHPGVHRTLARAEV